MSAVTQIAQRLLDREATLATAESCTGGLVGHLLTNLPGSSSWYLGGVVSYSNALKQAILGVREETLQGAGAVSAAVAEQMAQGARQAFGADYAVSVTGIAGPDGGTPQKPVGLTYVGAAGPERVVVKRFVWAGDRAENKHQSADAVLDLLLELLGASGEERERPTTHASSAAVEAAFEPDGRVRPLAFVWQGRRHKVTDWGRQWERDGVRHCLVMTSDQRVWEIRLAPAAPHWSVEPRTPARRMV